MNLTIIEEQEHTQKKINTTEKKQQKQKTKTKK